ncbi:hypothetical protein Taro_026031 [Colocasia esculenta]|uniref:Ribosomal RNA-processing protein 8 n=1 Tax=Colocasia esculenta TaxID=4460 RepID=A0A843VBT2_COLES|nr:hypothetical protein [Colocasia esculenta]
MSDTGTRSGYGCTLHHEDEELLVTSRVWCWRGCITVLIQRFWSHRGCSSNGCKVIVACTSDGDASLGGRPNLAAVARVFPPCSPAGNPNQRPMDHRKRKPKRRGKRRTAETSPPAQAAPPAAPRQENLQLQQQQRERKQHGQPFPEPKRRKCGGGGVSLPATSSFLDKMRARLSGGHFRMLNEKLYTCSGSEAFEFFKENPEFFDVYHAGYQLQMSHWPEQPVNVIIKWLQSHNPAFIVADFGCGNAHLAKTVKNKVFSIDLVASDPSVIACDMANTPLQSSSVDVAVFCLSLMGVNFPNYLMEASRVLRPHGWLLIAEVRSRFDPETSGADPDEFCKAVYKLGFSLVSKDSSNKMFVLFYFKKKVRWPIPLTNQL